MPSARDLAVKRGETVNYYKPDQLVIKPELNARDLSTPDNVAHVEWLANEMKAKGFNSILRVMVWEGELVLTEGHCRTAAVKLAIKNGWLPADSLVPALTEPKGTTLQDLWARQMSGNGTSKGLNAEEALANVKRLMSVGKTVKDVSGLVGKSVDWINQLLNFQSAPTEVHKMVAEGKVSLAVAAQTIRKKGAKEGAEALREGVAAAEASGRKKATEADVERRPKRLSSDLIESMVTLLRSIARGAPDAPQRAVVILERIDELRGE